MNRTLDCWFWKQPVKDVGTLGSPLFGAPVTARPPRQLQFSARMKF